MDRDGSNPRALGVANNGWVRRPAVSPDGKWIAFTRYAEPFTTDLEEVPGGFQVTPGLTTGIWIARLDRSIRSVRNVVGSEEFNSFASWGPDGRLYFTSTRSGSADIYRMRPTLTWP